MWSSICIINIIKLTVCHAYYGRIIFHQFQFCTLDLLVLMMLDDIQALFCRLGRPSRAKRKMQTKLSATIGCRTMSMSFTVKSRSRFVT